MILPAGYTSNENATGGRLIMIAVDESNIGFGRGRGLTRAASAFVDHLTPSDRVGADGMPLVWASRLQGTPLPERVPGSTLISTLATRPVNENERCFCWEAIRKRRTAAAAALKQKYPDCLVSGRTSRLSGSRTIRRK